MNSAKEIHWEALKSFTEITPNIKSHLVRVYSLLSVTVVSAALGAYYEFRYFLNWSPFLISLIGLGFLLAIQFTRPSPANQIVRTGFLLGFGFCQGVSIGPLLLYSFIQDPTIVYQTLVATSLVFVGFSISALVARRRSYLYIGGFLLTALSILTWTSLFNIFFQSRMVFTFELYAGLLLFSGFVVYDTQLIVEKVTLGDSDTVKHAADLFVDVFGLFTRILILLMDKKKKDEQRRRQRN